MMSGTIRFDEKYYFIFMFEGDKRKYYLQSDKVISLKHMGVDFKPFPHFIINDEEEANYIKENATPLVLPRSLWEVRMSSKRLKKNKEDVVNTDVWEK